MKKPLTLSLVVAVVFALCACTRNTSTVVPTDVPTPVPTYTPVPSAEVSATEEPLDANKLFEELDLELFTGIVTSDYGSYNQFIVSENNEFGITSEGIVNSMGDFTYEAHVESMEFCREILARLGKIDRNELKERNRYAYDAIKHYYENALQYEDFFYYYEPMTPMNGVHTAYPLSFTLFKIRSAEDVERYLYMLEDLPRVIGELEAFEVEKAELGLFMTEVALDQVVDSCLSFANEGETCFLIEYFEEVLEKGYEFGLSEEVGNELRIRNREAVINGILPAYASIAETLDGLRDKCTDLVGAKNKGLRWVEFYEISFKDEAATGDSMEVIVEYLESMGSQAYYGMISAMMSNPSLYHNYGEEITMGTTEDNMEWLEVFIDERYPSIPSYAVEFIDVPESIADSFSPAAYLIPPFDNYYNNTILLNPTANDSYPLLTLAHEGIPGHMYQSIYFRSMPDLSLTQQLITPTGYAEAWTVFTEWFVAQNCSDIGENYCVLINRENTFGNIFLPAYISFMVNYEGWSFEEVDDYLSGYGLNDTMMAELMYEYAVTMPYYAVSYAVGFSYMLDIYNDLEPKTTKQHREFFEEYLSYGPTYMDILNDYCGD